MTERVIQRLMQPISVASSSDKVHFGFRVQLLVSETPDSVRECFPEQAFALSVSPNSLWQTDEEQTISENSSVTVGACRYPSIRSTFIIVNPDGLNDTKSVLRFNEDFYLKCVASEDCFSPGFFLYSSARVLEHPRVSYDSYYTFDYTKGNLDQPVGLCREPSKNNNCKHFDCLPEIAKSYCRWKCVSTDPEYRYEYEGEPVLGNMRCLIVHSGTNKLLCPDFKHRKSAIFGSEFSVSAKYRDLRRRKYDEWAWILKQG